MAYSNFSTQDLKKLFGVEETLREGLWAQIPPRKISQLLRDWLAQNFKFALLQGTEKARSEYIIAPVFAELRNQSEEKISIFSGWELNVDMERGLNGRCDFLVSRSPYQATLEAPVIVAVEAKREDLDSGTTQCIAEMIGAHIFNEREGQPLEDIYGCVTTGDIWRFLVLHEHLAEVDPKPYDLTELEQIMGILWAMTFGEVPPANA